MNRPGSQRDVRIVTPIGTCGIASGLRKMMWSWSVFRYTKETVGVSFAHEKGIKHSPSRIAYFPLARYAQCVLPARCKMDSFIESFTAAFSPTRLSPRRRSP
jgi:hypothetical protein